MTNETITCTLTPFDFKARLGELKELTQDALISARRDDLTLHLRYALTAENRVRRMVEKEQECCAFLAFDLRLGATTIELCITAPAGARDGVGAIYSQFLENAPDVPGEMPPGDIQPSSTTGRLLSRKQKMQS
jgi:hypothetical protein